MRDIQIYQEFFHSQKSVLDWMDLYQILHGSIYDYHHLDAVAVVHYQGWEERADLNLPHRWTPELNKNHSNSPDQYK
jgi:hypothetical protein